MPLAKDPISPPDRGPFRRRVALTFDDGPRPGTTDRILDVLLRRGLKATFFITGERLTSSAGRGLVKRMIAEGHMVGNHGERHINLKDPKVAVAAVREGRARLESLVPSDALWWFRFPYGQASVASMQAVEDEGHAVVGWHVDSADWCYASPTGGVGVCHPSTFKWTDDEHRGDMPANIIAQAATFDGGIALMHDTHKYTADTLDDVVTALAYATFGFTWLDDVQVFPKLNQQAVALGRRAGPVLLG
ncbi:MAG: peptidoglycan/xylan/chitin deacetylase (PgdA/CDA1 family) [Kiritimatiellia bacterium]|jgi:peptidoglycan/xylan/chitin deacetylase (PgdA/CDA1 family)